MPPFLSRFSYVRSILPPVVSWVAFAFLLSIFFILSHPSPIPGITTIGWQSWDVVELPKPKPPVSKPNTTLGDGGVGGEDAEDSEGDGRAGALPLDSWNPFLPHTTGLTEVTAQACIWPPWLFESLCAPDSTPEKDSRLGSWVRVEKDLNRKSGLWWLALYYRRSRRFDVPYITSIVVVKSSKDLPSGFVLSSGDDLHSGAWPRLPGLLLAYKLKNPPDDSLDGIPVEEEEVVTEIDVLFGEGEPWFGFQRVEPRILEKSSRHPESVGLTVRMGVPSLPPTPDLRFHGNGTFRIMQVADLHYSVGDGKCRDTLKSPCVGDVDSAILLSEALDAQNPDFVVFSGDQLNGQGTSWDSMSVLQKFAQPVIDRAIPWGLVFGNHDDQDDYSRAELMNAASHMPYSLSQAGPADVDGVGNYLLKIYSGDASKMHLASIYMLDSGAYAPKKLPFGIGSDQYDWLKESQINWYLETSASISLISRPFQPDTGIDLGDSWFSERRVSSPPAARHLLPPSKPKREQQRRQQQDPVLKKPAGLMFFHIPLPEHVLEGDKDEEGNEMDVGIQMDSGGSPDFNSGFFEKGVLQGEDGVGGREVKVIGNGHVHIAENCRRISGVWMCFGGGGSYSGYGREGFDRRFRIFDLSEYGERITTFKYTEKGEEIDLMDLLTPA
ncbi:Metallo-dependent phosphatase-like protein [Mrakia frigida]|uniref:metallophosphoesterase family protein n=1 Tax=Mrakia frigida TaxID=29902 RepID=UPI003FCC04F7